ncbi:UTP--glucose-1-phosphate uridylyltransferase [Chryseomicrobium excrementi]|uniref:UTP--glucose-1-phosphate uridylyltransferase n=1 Tax=Chryseomicrobium excrementi TaxID=2041346 RepID=A0A2M9F0X2_9BACL|nr:UTP--glucose-1-phosphate uridylyltransferase GalU [Chryseomicrobium excrementi]PJK17100.1 UTP--glucose-1-phosphate uridylyltransferase [Chryseomicrobium excrementi]
MKPIKKAIIPAAGLGTRFLPATKATPKEMLPIIDKPMIQYIVEEAIASGIEDILIVTGKNKRAIEDHFDHSFELESHLEEKQKLQELFDVRQSGNVEIHYIRQKEPKGLGHAVWCARKFIGDEPFAVLLGDDIIDAEIPGLKQLINHYDQTGASVVAIQEVPANETNRYGIIEYKEQQGKVYKVDGMIEKPQPGTTDSRMAIMGRYILTSEIFGILDQQKVGAGGEVQLTDAIEQLLYSQDVYGYAFEGKRYDVGEKLGFVKTTIDLALKRPDLKDDVLAYLQEVLQDKKART